MGILRADLANVYRRMYRRFGIKQSTAMPGESGISSIIQPTVELGAVTKKMKCEAWIAVVNGVGNYPTGAVPAGVRRDLISVHAQQTSGTFTIADIALEWRNEFGGFSAHSLNYGGAGAAVRRFPDPLLSPQVCIPIVMDEGDSIIVGVGTHTVNGNLLIDLIFMEYAIQ